MATSSPWAHGWSPAKPLASTATRPDSEPAARAQSSCSRSGGAWAHFAYIKASNTGAGDQFGTSVSLSADGNGLAVGAPNEQSNATGVNGNQGNDPSFGFSGAVYA
ncbi:MAG: hypothetical protein R3F14_06390 [Polyangiaceae bacterium]